MRRANAENGYTRGKKKEKKKKSNVVSIASGATNWCACAPRVHTSDLFICMRGRVRSTLPFVCPFGRLFPGYRSAIGAKAERWEHEKKGKEAKWDKKKAKGANNPKKCRKRRKNSPLPHKSHHILQHVDLLVMLDGEAVGI